MGRPLPDDDEGEARFTGFVGLLHNGPLLAACLAFALAQVLKVFTFYYAEKRWDFTRLLGSGGMPSSHTSTGWLGSWRGRPPGEGGSPKGVSKGPPKPAPLLAPPPPERREKAAPPLRPEKGKEGPGGLRAALWSGLTSWYCPVVAQVVALTTALGVLHGTGSEAFAVGLVFSLVVMYDASGVRLHAGRQASVLNMIITELPPDHPVSDTRPLRDTLGHTPLQVGIGALLGCIVGYVAAITFLAAQ